jgi:hypothetical protein
MSVRDNIRVLTGAVKRGGFSAVGPNMRPSAAVVSHRITGMNCNLSVGFSTARPGSDFRNVEKIGEHSPIRDPLLSVQHRRVTLESSRIVEAQVQWPESSKSA